jgi:sortase (surface protein transpeptidase)
MLPLLIAFRTRFLPALVTAAGVVLVTIGLLSYADPATAGTAVVESPVIETLAPSEAPSAAIALPSPSADPSATVDPSAAPTPTASDTSRAVATRVVVPALRIDLPVIRGPDGYPLCDVAMYFEELGQPGEDRATYLYAHARDGMFGPIYELAIPGKNGKKMLGMIVQVYTSDDKLYLYEIREVRLHQLDLDDAASATSEELWLQTSEGVKGTPGKTQLRAFPISVGQADPADAHPKAKPVACG